MQHYYNTTFPISGQNRKIFAEAYSCKEGLEFELITRLPFLEDPVEKQCIIAEIDNEIAECKAFLAECLDEAYKLM